MIPLMTGLLSLPASHSPGLTCGSFLPLVGISWKTLSCVSDGCSVPACSVLLLSPLGELVDLTQGLKIHDSRGRRNEMEQKIRSHSQSSDGMKMFLAEMSKKPGRGQGDGFPMHRDLVQFCSPAFMRYVPLDNFLNFSEPVSLAV